MSRRVYLGNGSRVRRPRIPEQHLWGPEKLGLGGKDSQVETVLDARSQKLNATCLTHDSQELRQKTYDDAPISKCGGGVPAVSFSMADWLTRGQR